MRGDITPLIGKGFDKNPQNINRAGRPKKPVLQMKHVGYKLHEINDTIQQMIGMDAEGLMKIWENPKATILERTIASALRKGIEKGNLDGVETLLNRVYGKPKEQVDITTQGDKMNKQEMIINIIKTNQITGDDEKKLISE